MNRILRPISAVLFAFSLAFTVLSILATIFGPSAIAQSVEVCKKTKSIDTWICKSVSPNCDYGTSCKKKTTGTGTSAGWTCSCQ